MVNSTFTENLIDDEKKSTGADRFVRADLSAHVLQDHFQSDQTGSGEKRSPNDPVCACFRSKEPNEIHAAYLLRTDHSQY